ncbi:MAG: helix-turn-helix domain-containing protein [Rubrobacteraceae bacterium]
MREGVPDGLLASRALETFDEVEVARTRYLPGEMEVPPLRGYVVNLLLSGSGRMVTRLEGELWEGRQVPGGVEVFPGSKSQERTLDGTVSEAVNVLLDNGLVGRVAGEVGVDLDQVEIVEVLHAHDPASERILRSLASEIETGGPGGELYVRSLATALAVHLLREHSSLGRKDVRQLGRRPEGNLSRRQIGAALDYIGDNLSSRLSLSEISHQANLSERHFSRLFREATGLPPYRYVILQRVEKAKVLLANTDLPVGEVAARCGFAHQGHLARHFARLLGTSPVRFRRELGR